MAPNNFSLDDNNLEAQEENYIAILALVTLLIFFIAYCFWGTSCCENITSRLKFCRRGNAELSHSSRTDMDQPTGNPTIILLPHGRILVVDGSVFARFHANDTGLDLFELGDSVLRDENLPRTRSPSFVAIDSEATAKDCSPIASPLPPTYESIFGDCILNTPPPYSEALLAENQRNRRRESEEIERESTL